MDSHAIVLAAGASSRLGFPKALADLDGRPLLQAHLEGLLAVCTSARVVTGAHAGLLRPHLGRAEERHNPDWSRSEMRHSILCGLEGLPAGDRVLLLPVDSPPQEPALLRLLLGAEPPAALGHRGRKGHPVSAEAGWLRKAARTGPLRAALEHAVMVSGPPSCLLNLNSPADWQAWRGEPPLPWR